jgi:LytS/YehU family sensor histidine kinase
MGFQEVSGSGVGLANTRARLAALYGANGRLVFEANPVRGGTVRIELPYSDSSGHATAA